jgi:hypothetical protein
VYSKNLLKPQHALFAGILGLFLRFCCQKPDGITGMEKCQENIGASGSQTARFGL